jgi:hypothetical protein
VFIWILLKHVVLVLLVYFVDVVKRVVKTGSVDVVNW